ncbi:MAG: tetratricopeptide repeat protein [Deltaproteobacteria bacterium]|nr:MAG: tetratricopeptide repeat protein [Deltaproteobacteria bacterium]
MARPTRSSTNHRSRAAPDGRRREAAPVAACRPAVAGGSAAPALALVLLVVATYLPALRAGFIWDDDAYVTANATLRSFDGLRRIWLEPGAVPQYYPLTFTSLWLDYHLWGLHPLGYHLVNVLLHAANAILVWLVGRRLALPGAWFAAAVFAVHPVQVESVAWVTERKNVLSGALYLAAFLAYLRAADGARVAYGLALGLFVGALLAKTVTCTLPAMLLLVLRWKRERVDVTRLLPFFALGVASGLVTTWMETHHVGATGELWSLSLLERCLVAGRVLWFYAAKLVWPYPLAFIYARWHVDAAVWWQYLFPLAAAGVVAALYVVRRRFGSGPLVAVLCYAATLAPALGFINVYPMRYSFVADHFQYLAGLPLIALAAAAGATRLPRPRELGGAVVIALGILAWRQTLVYRDAETVWRDTLAKDPDSSMAHINLGLLLSDSGRGPEAIGHFREALRIDPQDGEAHDDLGNALAAQGKIDEAIAEYGTALGMKGDHALVHNNLGNALATRGRLADAAAHYREAIRERPRYAEPHSNLGNVLAATERLSEATAEYQAALRLDPDYTDAHANLATVLASQGDVDGAILHYQAALASRPHSAQIHFELATALAARARTAEAITHYREALRLRPDWPQALDGLAASHAAAGQWDAAVATAERALQVATATGDSDAAAAIRERLARYRARGVEP